MESWKYPGKDRVPSPEIWFWHRLVGDDWNRNLKNQASGENFQRDWSDDSPRATCRPINGSEKEKIRMRNIAGISSRLHFWAYPAGVFFLLLLLFPAHVPHLRLDISLFAANFVRLLPLFWFKSSEKNLKFLFHISNFPIITNMRYYCSGYVDSNVKKYQVLHNNNIGPKFFEVNVHENVRRCDQNFSLKIGVKVSNVAMILLSEMFAVLI